MAGSPPTPAFRQPLSLGQILDGGFAALRARPGALVASCAVFVIPFNVLTAWLQRDTQGGFGVWSELAGSSDGTDATGVFGIAVAALTPALVGVPTARVVWSWFHGRELGARAALVLPVRLWAATLTAALVLIVVKAVGYLLLVPGLVVGALTMLTSPVIAIEELGPFAAIRRSSALAGRGFWSALGVYVLTALIALMLGLALFLLPDGLEAITPDRWYPDSWRWVLRASVSIAGSFVTVPAVAAATAMLYIDRRMRTEGLDLRLRIPAEF